MRCLAAGRYRTTYAISKVGEGRAFETLKEAKLDKHILSLHARYIYESRQ